MPFEPYNQTQRQGFIPYKPVKSEGFVPADTVGNTTIQAQGLLDRFGTQLYNQLVPGMIEGVTKTALRTAPGVTGIRTKARQEVLAGSLGPKEASEMRKSMEKAQRQSKKFNVIPVPSAETFAQKGVDVAAGLTGFIAQLAILRKGMPQGTSEAVLWEMQNLMSGGKPGHGAAMSAAFGIPGKLIKGTGVAAKVGRLGAESTMLGGFTALQSKLETGEVDWEDVAISAGIPVALRSMGYVKSRIAVKDPKVLKAAIEVQKKAPVSPVEGKTPVKGTQVPWESKLDATWRNVKKTAKEQAVFDKLPDSAPIVVYHGTSPENALKMRTSPIADKPLYVSPTRIDAGNYGSEILKIVTTKGALKTPPDFPKLTPSDGFWHSSAGAILAPKTRINLVSIKGAATIDSANQRLLETTTTAKALNATEVKAANKALRRRQAGRGTKATLAAMRSGRGLGESIAAGRRAYGGKAKVPEITPPNLTPEQWNTYYKKILEIYPPQGRKGAKTQFQRTGTKEALDKLKAGVIPTNYDFGLLDRVLGRETTLQLHKNMAQHRKFGLWDIPIEVRDGLKSMFGYDPQVIRQGRGVALRHPVIYAKGVVANVLAYASQKQANKIQGVLEASPGWELSRKQGLNYLGVTPWASAKAGTRLQQYGTFTDLLLTRKNKFLKGWGRVLAASERGADVGINTMLKKMWDVGQADLAAYQVGHRMTPLQIEKWNKVRVHDINAVMKRVVAKNPKAREIQRAANWVLFSSAHTISRPISAWRSIKNLAVGKGVRSRTYAAQLTVSNIASLSALSAIGAYIGHKARTNDPTKEPTFDSSNDPTDSMWGKYRIGNDVIDLSGGDVGTYRLLARIGVSAYMYGKGTITGKEYTFRPPGEEIKRYLQSRETVLLGLSKTLATGKDWLGQPIGRKEALLKQFPMEFLVSVVEAGNADGMWEALQGGDVAKASKDFVKNIPVGVAGLAGLGTASYKVSTASTRFDFQDIIAKNKYNKKWEELNPIQQKVLKLQNKKQFDVFERKVGEERVDKPYNPTKIIEEQRKAGIRMIGKLDKVNRSKVKGVNLGISRSPEKFRLNDERYNMYQAFIAAYLNKFLSRITIKGKERSRSENVRIDIFVELAKRRALIDMKREMR